MQKGCSLINTYLTGVVNDQMYSVFLFSSVLRKVMAWNSIISSISLLMEEMEQSSIGRGQQSWRHKRSTCFVLRDECMHCHHGFSHNWDSYFFLFQGRCSQQSAINAEPSHLILTTVNNVPQEGCCMHVKITRTVNSASLTNNVMAQMPKKAIPR